MVISSLVVETANGYVECVEEALLALPGVEVHERNGFKLVVTIEAETVDESHDIAASMSEITGVLGVGLVYCNFEDDPSL